MPCWTLVDTHPTQGRTFRRPLDPIEISFLWDGLYNGSLDIAQHFQLRLPNNTQGSQLFSESNVVKAWLSTKRRFPLAGATLQGANGPLCVRDVANFKAEGGGDSSIGFTSPPHFVVCEHNLVNLRPQEVVFGEVASVEEAQRRVTDILNGPRPLSEELLVRLYAFRDVGSKETEVFHLITLAAHCATDGVGIMTFARGLIDTLARGGGLDLEAQAQIPLVDRLEMAIPSTQLEPIHLRFLSPLKRRWRRAIGVVIWQIRSAKRQGGHTLPCCITPSTPHVAARCGHVSTVLTHASSVVVIANCRLHNITFGNVYHVLAQVAMTRVLYRRYLRGEISEEEWEYRKKQQHMSGVPLNLRPFLDKSWFSKGGGGEFTLSVSISYYQLPFMTLGELHNPGRVYSDGSPPFSELLSFDRLLHRTELVKNQVTAYFKHPLFFEIMQAVGLARIERTRPGALQWLRRIKTTSGNDTPENPEAVLAVKDIPMVWGHGGSNLGDVSLVLPAEYPLSPSHPLSPFSSVPHPLRAGYAIPSSPSPLPSTCDVNMTPKIILESAMSYIHIHPAEISLGAASLHGKLHLYVSYDANVFEDGVVKEWLDEFREAVLWYLGQTHHSRREKERDNVTVMLSEPGSSRTSQLLPSMSRRAAKCC